MKIPPSDSQIRNVILNQFSMAEILNFAHHYLKGETNPMYDSHPKCYENSKGEKL